MTFSLVVTRHRGQGQLRVFTVEKRRSFAMNRFDEPLEVFSNIKALRIKTLLAGNAPSKVRYCA